MDPLIGDLTLTSNTKKAAEHENPDDYPDDYENPAIISTTFPRSIKQNEGYEIALKSIAHAPVKNIVRSEFTFVTKHISEDKTSTYSAGQELNLSSRFYESQADILTEIYRILNSLADPPPMQLYEKNGETTLKFTPKHFYTDENEPNEKRVEQEFYLDFRSDIFLNRPFKYKRFIEEKTLKRKKRFIEDIPDLEFRYKQNGKPDFQDAILRVYREFALLQRQIERTGQLSEGPGAITWGHIESMYWEWKAQAEFIINLKKKDWPDHKIQIEKVITDLSTMKDSIEKIELKDEEHIVRLKRRIEELETVGEDIHDTVKTDMQYIMDDHQNKMDYIIEKHQDSITSFINDSLTEMRQVFLGDDSSELMATDTSNFVSSKDKDDIKATQITVSAKPIVTTRLGFLYCSIVENSLINNKETRLLCIFPIVSKRGYSFYEINQTIYKAISVLQFSTITFAIVDSEGNLVEFSLEGDDLNTQKIGKKKYPTLLNLHIRKRL